MFKRFWNYLKAALTGKFEEVADPKIQIEQAINEAREQHLRLRETAASVIANQKKAEMDLDRAAEELEKLNRNTQQAVLMASDAEASGDTQRMAELTQTAETFAEQLIAKEQQVETLKQMLLSASRATEQAKKAVAQNATELQKKMAERQALLSKLDQADMAEQINRSMDSLSAEVGQDVPSLDEVRAKIEGRLARAEGATELRADSVEGRMLEVEQAAAVSQARARLSEIRAKMGVERPGAAAAQSSPATGAGDGAAPEPSPTPATPEPASDASSDSSRSDA